MIIHARDKETKKKIKFYLLPVLGQGTRASRGGSQRVGGGQSQVKSESESEFSFALLPLRENPLF